MNSSNKFTRVLANAVVTVYCPQNPPTLCPIFSDSAGTVVKANPFVAGSDGSYYFYTNSSLVGIRFSGTAGVPIFTNSDILVPTEVNNASTTVLGITKLDTAPVDPTAPIAVGVNSPLVTSVTNAQNSAYGLVYGAGATSTEREANLVGLQTALAVYASKPLYLPVGELYLDFTSGNTKINITASATILGLGIGKTNLHFGPSPATFAYEGLRITGGTEFRIQDLTLTGPTASSTTPYTVGISYQNATNNAHLMLSRVAIAGQFVQAFEVGAGYGSLVTEMDFVDFTAYDGTLNYFCVDGIDKILLVTNSRFHDTTNTSGANHLWYIHPSVSWKAINCRFENGQFYAIHNYGTTITTSGKYAVVDNCYFSGSAAGFHGILTNRRGPMTVTNSTFRAPVGINVQNKDVDISNCEFYADSGGTHSTGIDITAGTDQVTISHCKFDNSDMSVGGGFSWFISNSRFGNKSTIYIGVSPLTVIDNCYFNIANGATEAINANGTNTGKVIVRNSTFKGSASNAAIYNRFLVGVVLENNQFLNTGPSIRILLGVTDGLIEGSGNFFANAPIESNAGSYQYLKVRDQLNPSVVASAASTVLSLNYNQTHISGTATINNLWVGDNDPTSGTSRFFSGPQYLIADEAWTLANNAGGTGNLRTNTGANVTVAANQVVIMLQDSKTNLWHQQ